MSSFSREGGAWGGWFGKKFVGPTKKERGAPRRVKKYEADPSRTTLGIRPARDAYSEAMLVAKGGGTRDVDWGVNEPRGTMDNPVTGGSPGIKSKGGFAPRLKGDYISAENIPDPGLNPEEILIEKELEEPEIKTSYAERTGANQRIPVTTDKTGDKLNEVANYEEPHDVISEHDDDRSSTNLPKSEGLLRNASVTFGQRKERGRREGVRTPNKVKSMRSERKRKYGELQTEFAVTKKHSKSEQQARSDEIAKNAPAILSAHKKGNRLVPPSRIS